MGDWLSNHAVGSLQRSLGFKPIYLYRCSLSHLDFEPELRFIHPVAVIAEEEEEEPDPKGKPRVKPPLVSSQTNPGKNLV